jgi:hypothetical protein
MAAETTSTVTTAVDQSNGPGRRRADMRVA